MTVDAGWGIQVVLATSASRTLTMVLIANCSPGTTQPMVRRWFFASLAFLTAPESAGNVVLVWSIG